MLACWGVAVEPGGSRATRDEAPAEEDAEADAASEEMRLASASSSATRRSSSAAAAASAAGATGPGAPRGTPAVARASRLSSMTRISGQGVSPLSHACTSASHASGASKNTTSPVSRRRSMRQRAASVSTAFSFSASPSASSARRANRHRSVAPSGGRGTCAAARLSVAAATRASRARRFAAAAASAASCPAAKQRKRAPRVSSARANVSGLFFASVTFEF